MHTKHLKVLIIQSIFLFQEIVLSSLVRGRCGEGESDRNDLEAIKAVAGCHQQAVYHSSRNYAGRK